MIIIDKDKNAFSKLASPEKHVLINRDIREPKALAEFENAGKVIMAIDDFPTSVYAGLCAKTVYNVPRVLVYSPTDDVSLKALKLKAYNENTRSI